MILTNAHKLIKFEIIKLLEIFKLILALLQNVVFHATWSSASVSQEGTPRFQRREHPVSQEELLSEALLFIEALLRSSSNFNGDF